MTEEELKDRLTELKNKDIEWDSVNSDEIVDSMLKHSQTSDLRLQEDLVQPLFIEIIKNHYISETSIAILVRRCLDEEHLYLDIGDTASRKKMTRAFSMFIIKTILEHDAQEPYLSTAIFNEIRKQVILYLDLEQDYRGFTNDMGDVNSIAMSFEALQQLVENPRLDSKHYKEIFQALVNKIFVFQHLYTYDEEEIVIETIHKLLEKGLAEKEIIDFLSRIPMFLTKQKEKLDRHQYWNLYKNCKSFLQSLYINMDKMKEHPLLLVEVKKCLKQLK